MKKTISALITLFASLGTAQLARADMPTPPEYDTACMNAVAALQKQIIGKYAVAAMSVSSAELAKEYAQGFSQKRPYRLQLAFTGDQTEKWMAAPEQLQNAKGLIQKCGQISAVSFGVFASDWVNQFGIVGSATTPFECLDPGAGNPSKLPWGYYYCP